MQKRGANPVGIGCLAVIAFFAVWILLYKMGILQDDSADSTESRESCESAVSAQLTDPATADFSIMDLSMTQNEDGGWRISSTVDAENRLGIEESLSWLCITDADDNVETAQITGD